jgi:hypothetical protein
VELHTHNVAGGDVLAAHIVAWAVERSEPTLAVYCGRSAYATICKSTMCCVWSRVCVGHTPDAVNEHGITT